MTSARSPSRRERNRCRRCRTRPGRLQPRAAGPLVGLSSAGRRRPGARNRYPRTTRREHRTQDGPVHDLGYRDVEGAASSLPVHRPASRRGRAVGRGFGLGRLRGRWFGRRRLAGRSGGASLSGALASGVTSRLGAGDTTGGSVTSPGEPVGVRPPPTRRPGPARRSQGREGLRRADAAGRVPYARYGSLNRGRAEGRVVVVTATPAPSNVAIPSRIATAEQPDRQRGAGPFAQTQVEVEQWPEPQGLEDLSRDSGSTERREAMHQRSRPDRGARRRVAAPVMNPSSTTSAPMRRPAVRRRAPRPRARRRRRDADRVVGIRMQERQRAPTVDFSRAPGKIHAGPATGDLRDRDPGQPRYQRAGCRGVADPHLPEAEDVETVSCARVD